PFVLVLRFYRETHRSVCTSLRSSELFLRRTDTQWSWQRVAAGPLPWTRPCRTDWVARLRARVVPLAGNLPKKAYRRGQRYLPYTSDTLRSYLRQCPRL